MLKVVSYIRRSCFLSMGQRVFIKLGKGTERGGGKFSLLGFSL